MGKKPDPVTVPRALDRVGDDAAGAGGDSLRACGAREGRASVPAYFNNTRLWQAILARWPDVSSQSDAARRLGVKPTELCVLLNTQAWPFDKRRERWWTSASTIALALRDDEAYLFDRRGLSLRPRALWGPTERGVPRTGLSKLRRGPNVRALRDVR